MCTRLSQWVPGIYIYIYIYVCKLLRMHRHVRIPTVRSMGMNSCVCWLNTCVRCDHIMESETGQRARRLALGRERVQQARSRQTEEQRHRTGPGSWIGAEDGWLASDIIGSRNITFYARHLRMRISSNCYCLSSFFLRTRLSRWPYGYIYIYIYICL